ncbi:hypothetical protein [Clostridium botulinum]|nr:hypothetical protein [Clostridium botulinum]
MKVLLLEMTENKRDVEMLKINDKIGMLTLVEKEKEKIKMVLAMSV